MSEAKLAPNMPKWMVDHTNLYLSSGGKQGHFYLLKHARRRIVAGAKIDLVFVHGIGCPDCVAAQERPYG